MNGLETMVALLIQRGAQVNLRNSDVWFDRFAIIV